MSTDKELILSRIRDARPAAPDITDDIPRSYQRDEPRAGAADVLDLFARRLDDVGARLRRCHSDEVAESVADLLGDIGAVELITPPGLPADWLPRSGFRWLTDEPALSTTQLNAADGVITAVRAASADTATVVLDGGAGQGRRALSLVPDYQLCIIRAEQVLAGLPATLAALEPQRPITFVTGPSATVDIELVRVSGVHGPRHLDVLLTSGE